MQKEWTFEDLPAPDVTLDLYWHYSHTPAKTDGIPEGCWPEEEDSEICLPREFVKEVMNAYLVAARAAMRQIEDKVQDMQFDNMPKQWANEEEGL